MTDLPPAIAEAIQALAAAGDQLAEGRAYAAAVSKYGEAWRLLPEPKTEWEASTWLLAAIGDACFLSGQFEPAQEAFAFSMSCPGAFGNPFLHLRLGQCALEAGQEAQAAEELCRAYALEGKAIFANEPAKYFEFLKTRIQPPASGEW